MSNKLYAGVAWTDITSKEPGANDTLRAKVLALQYDDKKYALVSVDYICLGGGIGILRDDVFDVLKAEAKSLGVDTFLCGMTHTHTHGEMIVRQEELVEKIKCAIKEAFENLKPAKVGSSTGINTEFAINRTLKLKDGSYWSIRQAHPCPPDDEIDENPYADYTVGVIKVEGENGENICTVFTYGCHPLLGFANNRATSNYPGIAEKLIESEVGGMAMMFQSCGGDVTEIDYKNYDKPKSAQKVGESLGLTVLEVLKNIKAESSEIRDSIREVAFPRKKDIKEVMDNLVKEREHLLAYMADCPLNFKAFLPLYMKYLMNPEYPLGYKYEYMKEEEQGISQLTDQDKINRANIERYLSNIKIMERLSKICSTLYTMSWHDKYNASYDYKDVDSEVLGIRMGDALLLSAPVEPVSETGRRIRALSPLEKTFVVGYANGYMHYGSPEELYENGGYETIECMLSKDWYKIYEGALKEIFEDLK